MDNIIVLAGGESVNQFPYKTINKMGAYVIGVNDAFLYAPVDAIVTMDRQIIEHRFERLKKYNRPTFLRYSAYRVNMGGDDIFPEMRLFSCDHQTDEFGLESNVLNGRNSGYCALNLAYTLRPKNVYMLGFDMQGGYWWPPYPWAKLNTSKRSNDWIKAFETAKEYFDAIGTNVFVVGDSLINTFPKLTFQEFAAKCGK